MATPQWGRSITLCDQQQLGCITLDLSNPAWQALPGLSACDRLIAIRCRDGQSLHVARGKVTGQLLVRRPKGPNITAAVTVDYIVAPGKTSLQNIRRDEFVQVIEGICHPTVQQELKDDVFDCSPAGNPSLEELQRIALLNPSERLYQLICWAKSFSFSTSVPGRGLEGLVALIQAKQGVCQERCQVFQVLCHYFGIPARLVTNASHQYAEVSLDKGKTWRMVNLGGGGNCSISVHTPDFPEHVRDNTGKNIEFAPSVLTYNLLDIISEQIKSNCVTEDSYRQLLDRFKVDGKYAHANISYYLQGSDVITGLIKHGFDIDLLFTDIIQHWIQQIGGKSDKHYDEALFSLKQSTYRFLQCFLQASAAG
ncbi:transglutaminase domain-containing protein, partial [Sansalvadorimonas verongulae]|nr:transglutaminase domain-containing protein [Sansalvadorimonas verongulae]